MINFVKNDLVKIDFNKTDFNKIFTKNIRETKFINYIFRSNMETITGLIMINLIGCLFFIKGRADKDNMMARVTLVSVFTAILAVTVTLKFGSTGEIAGWDLRFWRAYADNSILIWYTLIINAVSFVVFGVDKYKAVKGRYRIPVAVLIYLAFAGGSVGTAVGMVLFRHKIRKNYFAVGVPMIIVMQIMLMVCGLNWG